jgi:hypothetical protein
MTRIISHLGVGIGRLILSFLHIVMITTRQHTLNHHTSRIQLPNTTNQIQSRRERIPLKRPCRVPSLLLYMIPVEVNTRLCADSTAAIKYYGTRNSSSFRDVVIPSRVRDDSPRNFRRCGNEETMEFNYQLEGKPWSPLMKSARR